MNSAPRPVTKEQFAFSAEPTAVATACTTVRAWPQYTLVPPMSLQAVTTSSGRKSLFCKQDYERSGFGSACAVQRLAIDGNHGLSAASGALRSASRRNFIGALS
ncbi:hypothetical protein J2D73_13035 [Acetobacter sacchari]|uniref:Uncharacterized protein n=1 Tax=Acetobacter sacchari TaxID=2661687 RepID=A0ABS3LXS2_9PROT|nr:hypothetical protein [Acetobacter sacchari]MBO1360712.1 hypothetical protein [Acetobacter sacchari]